MHEGRLSVEGEKRSAKVQKVRPSFFAVGHEGQAQMHACLLAARKERKSDLHEKKGLHTHALPSFFLAELSHRSGFPRGSLRCSGGTGENFLPLEHKTHAQEVKVSSCGAGQRNCSFFVHSHSFDFQFSTLLLFLLRPSYGRRRGKLGESDSRKRRDERSRRRRRSREGGEGGKGGSVREEAAKDEQMDSGGGGEGKKGMKIRGRVEPIFFSSSPTDRPSPASFSSFGGILQYVRSMYVRQKDTHVLIEWFGRESNLVIPIVAQFECKVFSSCSNFVFGVARLVRQVKKWSEELS